MNEKSLDKQIEDSLNSLDGIQRATAPDGFYERLELRIRTMNPGISSRWYHWLQAGVAAMLVLSFLNGFFAFQTNEEDNTAAIEDFEAEYFETTASLLNY